MEILFTGTASGLVSDSYHSSILVGSSLLIDAGDGTSRALMNAGIPCNKISSLLISHNHPDHIAGLPSLIIQMKLTGRKSPFRIYTDECLKASTWDMLAFYYIFKNNLPFPLEISGFSDGVEFRPVPGIIVKPIRNSHIRDKYDSSDFAFVRFASSSFYLCFDSPRGKGLIYSADLGGKQDLGLFSNYGKSDVFIVDGTHLPVEEIIGFAQKQNFERTFITHREKKAELKNLEKIFPARDLLRFNII